MSDLPGATQATGGIQNGGVRAAQGQVPGSADLHKGVRTPTDIMRVRRERDARRKAEEDAARQQEAEEQAQREQEESIAEMAEESPSQRRARTRTSSGEPQAPPRTTGGSAPASGGRRGENIAPAAAPGPSQSRANTVDQGQPRPVTSQQPGPGMGASRRNKADPLDPSNTTFGQVPPASSQPSQSGAPQPPEPNAGQPAGRSAFPHAFERWETLSSHWEGLTSYWVRRLQENSNEMNDKPILQQMSRQITDLSAAGANLFHAVVELQRLRASSDRKFQRWFFEKRQEEKRAQDMQAELERLLRAEQQERANALASIATAQADRIKADDLVKEMRRELQISKEEARRAWEELGRREQEERERTISLRSGEPTLVGGVQVVPMTQGVPSRQTSTANRPTTRDGPFVGGPGATTIGGQQVPRSNTTTTLDSPSDEQRQFSYEPQASSPTETDPFTESAQRSRQRQSPNPELAYYSSQQQPTQPTQPPTSSAAMAAARAAPAPATQRFATTSAPSPSRTHAHNTPSGGNGAASRFYQQDSAETTILNPTTTNGPLASVYQPARPGTTTTSHATDPSDQRSYIPSTTSGNDSEFGEEEYEISADGSYRRDAQGRRIPYPSGRLQSDDGSDEYDVRAEIERERQHRERYGAASASRVPPGSVPPPVPSAPTFTQQQQQQGASTYSQVTTSQPPGASPGPEVSPADYSGQGWGDEAYESRHRHPTRLSDILEERSSMNSPSRASYASGGLGDARASGGDIMGGFPSSRAPPGGRYTEDH